ncbi:MAG: DMT family transporter, partial [Muribaculaceae bacterium]
MTPITSNAHHTSGGGVLAGIFGAATFGFIPAFSIPALQAGMSPTCILFYRFGIATIIIAIILSLQGKSLKLPMRLLPTMILLAIFYCFSGGLLVMGYKYMSAGVTGVIHFTYPVFVMLILVIFYNERLKISSMIAICTAIMGIYCLGVLGGEQSFVKGANPLIGVIIVISSGIACASYMVGVNKTQARTLPSLSLTFWLLLISTVIFGILSLFNGSMILVTDLALIADLSALALIATVISNFLLV